MLEEGQEVEIIDTFNGHNRVVIAGTVERANKATIFVRTAHGDLDKFRAKDNKQVGYSWPGAMLAVREKKAR